MHCIECNEDCAMKYERYMDVQTPCLVCARAKDMPTPECWRCIKGECQFVESDDYERNLVLQKLY